MKRIISNLGQQIHQPSKPYANLAWEGVCCSQVNALISIIPELDTPPKSLSLGSINLDSGYVLLHKQSKYSVSLNDALVQALWDYLPFAREIPCFIKWVWLLLPNGQIACSAWRETLKSAENIRVSWNVKVCPLHCWYKLYYLCIFFIVSWWWQS